MTTNTKNEFASGAIAVLVGAITGIASFFLLFLIWSLYDYEAHPREPGTYQSPTRAAILVPILLGCLLAGFITARISSQRRLMYAAITGIVLILIWVIFVYSTASDFIVYLILPLAIIGGWLRARLGRNRQ